MRVVVVHNRYQEPGGEDAVFAAEADLLEGHGHTVRRLEFTNAEFGPMPSAATSVRLGVSALWARGAAARVGAAASDMSADVVHFHNTFPLVSPAAYRGARRTGAAVVQTLHNYRLLCPSALFFREGVVCEDCLGKVLAWPGVRHACYRGSRTQTAVAATMVGVHRLLGTWTRHVDSYIALTDFLKQKYIEGGWPAGSLVVKPNFVSSAPSEPTTEREGFLFVGRLSENKGLPTLLDAWQDCGSVGTLRIAGGGPLEAPTRLASERPGVHFLGQLPRERVVAEMHGALALVFPSEWYEAFPVTLAEAFACGLPVIAGRLGAAAEIVEDGRTGLHFRPGDAGDLAAKLRWAAAHPAEMLAMGRAARAEYEAKYTPDRNYEQLMAIYELALARRRRGQD